jgi:hypothetical protein
MPKSNDYYERNISLTFNLREIGLMQDAITDRLVEWRREVKRRKDTNATMGRLEENLGSLELVNDDLKAILAKGR